MKSDFQKMIERAVEIKEKYKKIEPKKWDEMQMSLGMMKDMGDFCKLLTVKKGYRKDYKGNIDDDISHELSDLLWGILVLSKMLDVDLKKVFFETMDELENRLK